MNRATRKAPPKHGAPKKGVPRGHRVPKGGAPTGGVPKPRTPKRRGANGWNRGRIDTDPHRDQSVHHVAVAEKVSALHTAAYFNARRARGNLQKALTILRRAGVGTRPTRGTTAGPQTDAKVP